MSAIKQFEKHFSEDNLKKIYEENVIQSSSTGIDNLSHKNFQKDIDKHISIVSRKVLDGSYNFTKYKLQLVSKGRGKPPREISIPTIRDRIVLRAICNFLTEKFEDLVKFELPQKIMKNIKFTLEKKQCDGFIKLDVKDFYPSIQHKDLLTRLRRKIRSEIILALIKKSIQVPTVEKSSQEDKISTIGIPQGLSISNILAAIYLTNIDRKLSKLPDIEYYRYVDDILIFTNHKKSDKTAKKVINEFKKLGLNIHQPSNDSKKSTIGKIGEEFNYLGYSFKKNIVTVRKSSIDKLKESLVSRFTRYKYWNRKNKKLFLWRLNLRITGCIYQNKCRGWLFFFSEIDDQSLLHKLDNYVKKLIKRFSVKITPKKFVRTYFQIKHNKHKTNYIPNFDEYDLQEKINLLQDIFNINTKNFSEEEVVYQFIKVINREVKHLLIDIQDFYSKL